MLNLSQISDNTEGHCLLFTPQYNLKDKRRFVLQQGNLGTNMEVIKIEVKHYST